MKEKKTRQKSQFRSAKNGQFVNKQHAEQNPETTVKETNKPPKNDKKK